MLMALTEKETKRSGFDLVVLPSRVAHERAPEVFMSTDLALRNTLKQHSRHHHRIV